MVNTLIVDVSDAFRQSMRRLLASRFPYMRIAEAATRGEAVLLAHAIGADLVFADVRLPDGSGLDLPDLIGPTLPQARVCIVTSHDLPEYRAAARASGAAHFLAKADSTSDQIAAVVEATLAHRPRALVVDRDAARRGTVCANLQAHWPAALVFGALDARAGLAMASAIKPELVLVALSLLVRSRPSLGPAMKALDVPPTVVALVRSHASNGAAAREAGADHAVEWGAGIDGDGAAFIGRILSHPRDDTSLRAARLE